MRQGPEVRQGLADGEYITFGAAGVPTYHLDTDTSQGNVIAGDLDCGGVVRSFLCCYPKCQ